VIGDAVNTPADSALGRPQRDPDLEPFYKALKSRPKVESLEPIQVKGQSEEGAGFIAVKRKVSELRQQIEPSPAAVPSPEEISFYPLDQRRTQTPGSHTRPALSSGSPSRAYSSEDVPRVGPERHARHVQRLLGRPFSATAPR